MNRLSPSSRSCLQPQWLGPLLLGCALAAPLLPLTACSQTPRVVTRAAGAGSAAEVKAETAIGKTGLTSQTVYGFLLGEIAHQRGDARLASEVYLNLAERTRDAQIAKRAAEIAAHAQDAERALQAARLWQSIEPGAERAQQTVLLVLLKTDRLDEAHREVQKWLSSAGANAARVWNVLPALFARAPKPERALETLTVLAQDTATDKAVPSDLAAEAYFAVARLAWQIDQAEAAHTAIEQALVRKPDWEKAALFKAQTGVRKDLPATVRYLADFVTRYPQAYEVRAAYAAALVQTQDVARARVEYATLLAAQPGNPRYAFAAGVLAMRDNAWDSAEQFFNLALNNKHPNPIEVQSALGELAERRHHDAEALRWYRAAAEGQGRRAEQALFKSVAVLGRLGRIEEGRAMLSEVSVENDADRIVVLRAEVQMLREAKDMRAALQVLEKALQQFPDQSDLLYDRAMVAEAAGQWAGTERDLRRLIALNPDNAHAYNALGYTLVDRLDRVAEAIPLLEKALKLSPDDPFILDSLGWAYFKAGRLSDAEQQLRAAFAAMPDAEVALHLGEVLWGLKRFSEAQVVWQKGLHIDPESAALRAAMQRTQP